MQRRQRKEVISKPPPLTSTGGDGSIPPASLERWCDRHIRIAEAGWRATGDPWFFAEVVAYMSFRCPEAVPAWVSEAAWRLACERRTQRHATRARERATRFVRFSVVRDIRARGGLTWEEVFVEAARALKATPKAGKAATMEKAYKAVRADIKANRFGLYHVPHYQHRD